MILAVTACFSGDVPFDWKLPANVPSPVVPADNPMTPAKVELGRRLFYDVRLSIDGDMSCVSCHRQELAFTDGRARGLGTTGELHRRGPMSLANIAYAPRLGWASSTTRTLEQQALAPLFGDAPVEMGLADQEAALRDLLTTDPVYAPAFAEVWRDDPAPHTVKHLVQAIASFERTLLSFNSPYDQFRRGEGELSERQQLGMELFFSERLECFHCHGGFTFTDSLNHEQLPAQEVAFHNTALYPQGEGGPTGDRGLFDVSERPSDDGRFKAPTLRNIAVTAPYMHDGSIADLPSVLDHYADGGRAGMGHPAKSEFVMGFILDDAEKAAVVDFLGTLTDPTFLQDPTLADPFRSAP